MSIRGHEVPAPTSFFPNNKMADVGKGILFEDNFAVKSVDNPVKVFDLGTPACGQLQRERGREREGEGGLAREERAFFFPGRIRSGLERESRGQRECGEKEREREERGEWREGKEEEEEGVGSGEMERANGKQETRERKADVGR